MLTNNRFRGFAAASILISAAGCLTVSGCQGEGEGIELAAPHSGLDIQVALDALPGAQVVDVDEAGVPSFVSGQLGKLDLHGDLAAPEMQESLRDALARLSPVFRLQPENLVLGSLQTDNEGDQHLRFAQFRNGLEVLGGELLVHVRDGQVFAFNGGVRGDVEAPSEPTLTPEEAVVAAQDVAAEIEGGATSEETRLAYTRSHGGDRLQMVYIVKMTGTLRDGTPVDTDVLVDALDGSIAGRMPHVHTAKNRSIYSANNGTSLPGTLKRSEGGAANADAIVNNNYDRIGTVYDCYKTLFNRDSYNNAGAILKSTVHYSNNYVNAYWNGTQMVYGDGDGVNASNLANSLDVTAHELTHAVTSSTSNLVYEYESGGLNEAMSDILGETCEWYRDGQVVSANTWKVGEDIWTPGTAGDALRYMNDPKLDGLSLDYYTDYKSSTDVHYSSGIPNLVFYLLSQGGIHPRGRSNINVTGIGIAKAAQIFYKANTSLFTSQSTFAAAKTATEQAASQLGYSAAEIASVTAAWQAVGVGVAAPPGGGGSELSNGVAKTGLSGAVGSKAYYTLVVPAGATSLTFTMSGGTGDADLYVRFGSQPTTSTYNCRPYKSGNNETCTMSGIQAGTYHVMLNGYKAYSGVSLVGAYVAGGAPAACTHDKCVTGTKLVSGCDPCVTSICAADAYCCNTSWDATCVGEVASVCGLTCP